MKHIKYFLLIFSLLFIFILPVSAEDAAPEDPIEAEETVKEMPPQKLPPGKMQELRNVQMKAKEKAQGMREETMEKREDMMEKKDTMMQKREGVTGGRCEFVTQRVEKVSSGLSRNHQGQVKKFAAVAKRLEKIEATFAGKGYDTAALSEAIETLQTMLIKLNTDYQAFIVQLEETKEFECGESQGDFKTAMEESKTSLTLVKEDIMDLQEHYRTVIRPELKKLQEQGKSEENNASGEAEQPIQ